MLNHQLTAGRVIFPSDNDYNERLDFHVITSQFIRIIINIIRFVPTQLIESMRKLKLKLLTRVI